MFSAITSIFAVFFFINRMQCSLSVKTSSLLLGDDLIFGLFRERGCQMSEPDLLSEVHPVADLCSHFRDPEPTTPYG